MRLPGSPRLSQTSGVSSIARNPGTPRLVTTPSSEPSRLLRRRPRTSAAADTSSVRLDYSRSSPSSSSSGTRPPIGSNRRPCASEPVHRRLRRDAPRGFVFERGSSEALADRLTRSAQFERATAPPAARRGAGPEGVCGRPERARWSRPLERRSRYDQSRARRSPCRRMTSSGTGSSSDAGRRLFEPSRRDRASSSPEGIDGTARTAGVVGSASRIAEARSSSSTAACSTGRPSSLPRRCSTWATWITIGGAR